MSLSVNSLLASLPPSLRDELFEEYNKLLKNYRECRWEPAELDGGRLCEIVYTILAGYISNSYPAKATKPINFPKACLDLEKAPTTVPRSIRIQIPRVLLPLYEVRNNRGVGHVGGDVNSNRMDATYVVSSAKWILAELIRLFHNVSINDASDAIELIVQKESEYVWNVGANKRVLIKGLDFKKQTLLLLYGCVDGKASDQELFEWVEYSSKSMFKTKILRPMHKSRFIEYDERNEVVHISPDGINFVENYIIGNA